MDRNIHIFSEPLMLKLEVPTLNEKWLTRGEIVEQFLTDEGAGPWEAKEVYQDVLLVYHGFREGGGRTYIILWDQPWQIGYFPAKGQGEIWMEQILSEDLSEIKERLRYLAPLSDETRDELVKKLGQRWNYPWAVENEEGYYLIQHEKGSYFTRSVRAVEAKLPWWVDTEVSPQAKAFKTWEGLLIVFEPERENPSIRLVPWSESVEIRRPSQQKRQGDCIAQLDYQPIGEIAPLPEITLSHHRIIPDDGKLFYERDTCYIHSGRIEHPEHETLVLPKMADGGYWRILLLPGTSRPFQDTQDLD